MRVNIILLLVLLVSMFLNLGYRRDGPAEVKEVVSHSSGALHAALLFQHGHATVGTRTYVAIFRGQPPRIGDTVLVQDICYVFTAYRVGPWKMTWTSESRIELAISGPIRKDYEEMIEQDSCDGVESRWYFEREPAQP